jgi:abortive infection bacteriophage resistance protein
MTDPQHYCNQAGFEKTLSLIQREQTKTKEDFIVHFRKKYSDPYPPVWMVAEIIPLGVLCNLYGNLNNKALLKKVSHQFGLPLPVFSSWILLLANLRNLCGHHARLWNKEVPMSSHELKNPLYPWINSKAINMKRIYFRICIIKYLLFSVSPNSRFGEKLKALLAKFPTIDVRAMGFPSNWQNEPLWH